MKKTSCILLLYFIGFMGCVKLHAQIVVKENVHMSDTVGHCDTSFSIKEIKANHSSKYIKKLIPLLDTLASNESAQMYVWDVVRKDRTIVTCIQNWRFSFFSDANHRNNIYGVLRYGTENNKCFFVRCEDGKETEKVMRHFFHKTDAPLSVEFEYNIIPPDEYIIEKDLSTLLMCNYKDGELEVMKFFYNNALLK